MTSTNTAIAVSRLSGRWVLLAIAAVCLLPLTAAMYFRFVSPPATAPLAGQALEPFMFPYALVRQTNGQPMPHPDVSDHWLVVYAGSGACATDCRDALYLTRQARTAQGRNMERIQRVWVLADAKLPAPDLLAAHPDLLLLQATDAQVMQQLTQGATSTATSIFLVDRRGFVVFRYPTAVDPGAFIRELGKLVKF